MPLFPKTLPGSHLCVHSFLVHDFRELIEMPFSLCIFSPIHIPG